MRVTAESFPACLSRAWRVLRLPEIWPAIAVGLSAAIVLAGLLGFDLWRAHQQLEAQAFRETGNLVQLLDSHIEEMLRETDQALRTFSDIALRQEAAGGFKPARLESASFFLLQALPAQGLALLDSNGIVVASSLAGLSAGQDRHDSAYFRDVADARSGDAMVVGKLTRSVGSNWIIPLSRRLFRPNGTIAGVVVVAVAPARLIGLFDTLRVDALSAATLAQRDGTIIVRSPSDPAVVGRSIAAGELFQNYLPVAPQGTARFTGTLYPRELLMTYRALASLPFVMNVAFEGRAVFRPLIRLGITYLVLGLTLSIAIGIGTGLALRDRARRRALADAQCATERQQAQKMEALGMLASGIAHDFNNVLASIMGYTSLLSDELDPAGEPHGFVKSIDKAAHQGRDLVNGILTFSRPDRDARQPLELGRILSEVRDLTESSRSGAVIVACDCPAFVLANQAQLIQIFLNLGINGLDSQAGSSRPALVHMKLELKMPAELDREPMISMRASRRRLGRPDFDRRYVRVTVRDSGSGIPSAIIERIFDPFFTTKEREQGTGLGLAVVQSIVLALGGVIDVESEIGVGTCFSIFLPEVSATMCDQGKKTRPASIGTNWIAG